MGSGSTRTSAGPQEPSHKPIVVVELFTAEGCSSCPPADELLAKMAHIPVDDVSIIPLGFHVTYWNEGWRDRFSAENYTDRQKRYGDLFNVKDIYTPQAVIDGHYQTVGNDGQKIVALIRQAAAEAKPVAVDVAFDGGSVAISAKSTNPGSGQVLLAITEDDLSTDVKAGENRSRTLRHSAVVRWLDTVGKMKNGEFTRSVALKINSDWQREKLHAVVIVQDSRGRVLGAGTTMISPRPSTQSTSATSSGPTR
jgi:hypothetical protein